MEKKKNLGSSKIWGINLQKASHRFARLLQHRNLLTVCNNEKGSGFQIGANLAGGFIGGGFLLNKTVLNISAKSVHRQDAHIWRNFFDVSMDGQLAQTLNLFTWKMLQIFVVLSFSVHSFLLLSPIFVIRCLLFSVDNWFVEELTPSTLHKSS